jgi:hypothetical protein
VYSKRTCEAAAAGAHVHVLQFLRDEGCEWHESACSAAARNAHMPTLKWLREQGCPWAVDRICGDAAESGSIEMLLYLKQQGGFFNEYTLTRAARKGQLAVCHLLVAEQCPCDVRACMYAAVAGDLETVRFLHESGCPWDADSMVELGAGSGSVELLRYLKQQGCAFNAQVMTAAAAKGHTQLCQFLRAEQCPWDARACENAARGGSVHTLHWWHEQGCPWDVDAILTVAAKSGHTAILTFMQSVEPAASAEQLTEMLNAAGSGTHLAAAQWLRQQGAEWPAVLEHWGRVCSGDALQWARDEGCTSPTD